MTDIHELRIIGWDFGVPDLKLYCNSGNAAPCFADCDEAGNEIGRRTTCNLVEWFENVGAEMVEIQLSGPPPWRVWADWSNFDYPVLTGIRPEEG